MDELDRLIKTETDSINTIGITDPISEEYLKDICEKYHQVKVKTLGLFSVSQQRELLTGFCEYINLEYKAHPNDIEYDINTYLNKKNS